MPNGPDFDCQTENDVTRLALFYNAKWPSFHLPKTEVDAVPISDGRVTGYGMVIGWDKSNSYFLFEVRPSGDCGFVKVQSHMQVGAAFRPLCPIPTTGTTVRIRVEVRGGHTVAFLNNEFVAEANFPEYQGGLIGFEAYNGGTAQSHIAAQVRFDNLIVWEYPD